MWKLDELSLVRDNYFMESRPRIVLYYQTVEGIKPILVCLNSLKDAKGKVAVFERLKRAQRGTLGHCDDLGEGVWGFKIDVGPGYRVYFGQDGQVLIILLCGGEKHRQDRDAKMARAYWQDYKARKQKGREK